MTPTRRQRLLLRWLPLVVLLDGAAVLSGCGSDGAATVHIDSPKARKQMMQSGAGVAPAATSKRDAARKLGNSPPRPTIKNHAPRNR
jgi:hypothetical protein